MKHLLRLPLLDIDRPTRSSGRIYPREVLEEALKRIILPMDIIADIPQIEFDDPHMGRVLSLVLGKSHMIGEIEMRDANLLAFSLYGDDITPVGTAILDGNMVEKCTIGGFRMIRL